MDRKSIRKDRFGQIWAKSLEDSGKTKISVAKELGVSRQTVENWIEGVSSPKIFMGFEWFRVLHLNPFRYFMDYWYPDLFEDLQNVEDEEKISGSLSRCFGQAHPGERQMMLYIITGAHGSSPWSLLHLFTAYLHLPLDVRTAMAQNIVSMYEANERRNELVCPDLVKPNIPLLKESIQESIHSISHNGSGYTTGP